jgi:very-short-patch-repair endonuclease
MTREILKKLSREARRLARRQHWVITRAQLLVIGFTDEAIDYRIETGRLHPIHAGVYAVDRPASSLLALFVAAVLACGEGAALSHESAAQLWQIRPRRPGPIHVSVPAGRRVEHPGLEIHHRTAYEVTRRFGIPVTTPICTIVDVAPGLGDEQLERCVNEAANRDLVHPDRLHAAVRALRYRRGARRVRMLLDRDAFVVTHSMLEQRFLRIVRRSGLPLPETQRRLPGGRVDFYWPDRGLVVEADSLRFHRTPFQQRADALRDQTHFKAEIRTLRFTHWQIWHEPDYVETILQAA